MFSTPLHAQDVDLDPAPTLSSPFVDLTKELDSNGYVQIGIVYNSSFKVYRADILVNGAGSGLVPAIPLTDQAGVLYVPANPALVDQDMPVSAIFYGYSNKDGSFIFKESNAVHIPDYQGVAVHQPDTRVNHTTIDEDGYSMYVPRYNSVCWYWFAVAEEAIPGDYFEVQRAYESDFSDAVTVDVIAKVDSATRKHYYQTFVDRTEGGWWNPVKNNDSIFYRVRRSSAAVWGWEPGRYAINVPLTSSFRVWPMPFAENACHGTFEPAEDFESTHKVNITIDLFANGLRSTTNGVSYWDKNQRLVLRKILPEFNDTISIIIPNDSIEAALRRAAFKGEDKPDSCLVQVHYTDYANTPCVHYAYHAYIDTSDVVIKQPSLCRPYYLSAPLNGPSIYYTEAANINTCVATQEVYPDHVLLTWEPTDGNVDTYTVEARPNDTTDWQVLAEGLTECWYRDYDANPEVSFSWQYRLTMIYTCNGNTKQSSANTLGSRLIYGKVSGHILYEDGTGCPGIIVTASRVDNGEVAQRVVTDESGAYMLDSLLYLYGVEYAITPNSQTAEFRYNNTSSASATIRLTHDQCVVDGIDFENISCVRFTGRVLYENSTIPVRDVQFMINGRTVKSGSEAYKSDASGNFSFNVPKSTGFTLQAMKDGHWFAGDGFIRIDGDSILTLTSPLDGVRIYDQTTVRLIGRLVGGNDQAQKPLGFGLSKNNLGDDLQMVFELEGDNISQIVHIPSDLTISERDTVLQHTVVTDSTGRINTVGATNTTYYKKRIIVRPDVKTGEFAVDLYPVKYKISQATALGYATLYANGKTGETLDLSKAPLSSHTLHNNGRSVRYNETYCITYHSPIHITYKQLKNGLDVDYLGDTTMTRISLTNDTVIVPIATKTKTGYTYLFGAPVFNTGTYKFRVSAHEDYYYNNDTTSSRHELVRLHKGTLKVYNDMHQAANTEYKVYNLDKNGQAQISIVVDNVSFVKTGSDALCGFDLSVNYEGDYVEQQAVRGYITGSKSKGNEFVTYNIGNDNIVLLDILRDPPGANSYAYLEKGATYHYNYLLEYTVDFSLGINLGFGSNASVSLGAWAGVGGGAFSGSSVQSSSIVSTSLTPVQIHWFNKEAYSYTFTTNERIETGRDNNSVGSSADVFIGVAQNACYSLTDAVRPINATWYQKLSPQINNGTVRVVAQGKTAAGAQYYLVIGTEAALGTYFKSSFAYTQDYIENTLIPQLSQLRDASQNNDTIAKYNNTITQWQSLLLSNEREKLTASQGTDTLRQDIGRWSLGGTTQVAHDESIEYSKLYGSYFEYGFSLGGQFGSSTGGGFTNSEQNAGTTLSDANRFIGHNEANAGTYINGLTPAFKFSFSLQPTIAFNYNNTPTQDSLMTRKSGFVLATDPYGHMDVSAYRLVYKKAGVNALTDTLRDKANVPDSYYYGMPVYYLNGGASRCPWEPAEYTRYYTPQTLLSAGTLKLENQKIDIDVHERSNIPADQPAVFNLQLTNEGEMPYGSGNSPITFYLKLQEGSNPKGAKIMIDGMPLTGDGRAIRLVRGEIINKTMEVYAGAGYDFENIVLILESPCDASNQSKCSFSVHYTPVACPVHIVAPHDNWVLNTLSPHDPTGYYLPVVIDGFDIHYNGFDHIELQYKLSNESDDKWVTLCSYFADKSLYQAASGDKQMISGGRIENIHFYGERDPMEQQYNLRAVAFCRHGSGLISRASEVLTGMKDTRCPKVFGEPQPVDAILRVGDNLALRFNEPIAGNYLDEDNNFQVLGTTNANGISTGTSLHFDGTQASCASTQLNRSLAEKSFTVDMLVRPNSPNGGAVFFKHGAAGRGLVFGLDGSNRLYVQWADGLPVRSKPLQPITDFTRVLFSYDHNTNVVRFYAGTEELTDEAQTNTVNDYNVSAPLVFGNGLDGNMLEVRLWSKALGLAEIAETHMKRLNGSEQHLEDYYPMNEGRGSTVADKSGGATLMLQGATWSMRQGIALRLDGTQPLTLNSNVLARSAIQDATLMLWFKTAQAQGSVFAAGREKKATGDYYGLDIRFADGALQLLSDSNAWIIGDLADNGWHHLVLSVSRTFNQAAVYVDGVLTNTFAATHLTGISGQMIVGGDGFNGSFDELAVFEQALPYALIRNYDNLTLTGQEMGLIGYLPLEQQRENSNGVMETVFSPNDQREFKDSEGNIVNKTVLLITQPATNVIEAKMVDKKDYAPIREHEHLTKLNYDWAFNGDELLISLKMHDKEINKQNLYITVRDVEDLRGNPMAAPVTWTAYVDRNTLKWNKHSLSVKQNYEDETATSVPVDIINNSGKRHQFVIEALPDWMTVSDSYGSLEPEEEKTVMLTFNPEMAVGEYSAVIYLTDENSLAEPLRIDYSVTAQCPYAEPDKNKYPSNMFVCGQVVRNGSFDTNSDDKVIALYRNECVGLANITFDSQANRSDVYLTIHGNDAMYKRELNFLLWQASTGRLSNLTTSTQILYANNAVYGCTDGQPVLFDVSGHDMQVIQLNPGWNWVSFNLDLQPNVALISKVMSATTPWAEGDIIKNPATQHFVVYNEQNDAFMGDFNYLRHIYTYMVLCQNGNTMRICGNSLSADSMYVTLRGGGLWSAFPCLFNQAMDITEALADYYDRATPGDLIKSHDRFAVFTNDRKWVGDLTAIRPGEGYFFRRQAEGDVNVKCFNKPSAVSRRRMTQAGAGRAATNMTMIAELVESQKSGQSPKVESLRAYIGDELVGVTEPIMVDDQPLYFLTIQSDAVGELRFEAEDGTPLTADEPIAYAADAHAGSLKSPVMLRPADERPYKIIENDHVIIIRNNEKYDITGQKL